MLEKNISYSEKTRNMYLQLRPVWDELNGNFCNYANIKGEALSLQAYGENGRRQYGDIDILISRENIKFLEKILKKNGFYTKDTSKYDKILYLSASHQTTPWKKTLDNGFSISVDVNFDVFWGEYTGKRFNMDSFLHDAKSCVIFGCTVKVLPIMKAFIQLVLHHYKEMNSIYHLATHNSINRKMFDDVYNLIVNNKKELSVSSLYESCVAYDIVPYVYYILFYTYLIYRDDFLGKYVEKFSCEEGDYLLDKYGLSKKEQKVWKFDFETRLKSENLLTLIKNDLTDTDFNKIKDNIDLFD